MEQEKRDFKGVWIPKEIWLDKRLNALDKIILAEIDSLDSSESGCWASNKHIADFCQCSETKVSTAISKLIDCGYLYLQKFDGRQRELKSRLSNFERQDIKKLKADCKELKESNTYSNPYNNPPYKERKKASSRESFDEIISEFAKGNEKTTELLQEWLKARKSKRAAMTNRAIQINISRLAEYAAKSGMTIEAYLEEVLARGWASFYPINNYLRQNAKQVGTNGIAISNECKSDLDGLF